MDSKKEVEAIWFGTLKLYLKEKEKWESVPFRQEYKLKSYKWEWGEKISQYEEVLSISKSLEQVGDIQRLTIKEINDIYSLYIELEKSRLAKLSLSIEKVPIISQKEIERLIKEDIGVIVGAIVEKEIVGLGIATFESGCDDLLKGPYGDIIFIGVKPSFFGFGIESRLFVKLREWLKERNVQNIRSTFYSGLRLEELLLKTLGAYPISTRVQF